MIFAWFDSCIYSNVTKKKKKDIKLNKKPETRDMKQEKKTKKISDEPFDLLALVIVPL